MIINRKDLQHILGCSYDTAKKRYRVYLDILQKPVKQLNVYDLVKVEDSLSLSVIEKSLGRKIG